MENTNKFTPSQIRYIIWLFRLSKDGFGVKNVELATALDFSKPSVHNMLKSLAALGIVRQENFGLAHFTEEGLVLAKKYATCFSALQKTMHELCGENTVTEASLCALLSDMPKGALDTLYEMQSAKADIL